MLFLNAKNLFLTSIKSLFAAFVRVISLFTTIYASIKWHKSDLSIDVLNLIGLFGLYLSLAAPDWSWTSTHFLVINLGIALGVVPNKFAFFGVPFLCDA